MSPTSNTSSVEAQNGSSYSRSHADFPSRGSSSHSTYPYDSTTRARFSVDVPHNSDALSNAQRTHTVIYDHHYQNGYAVDYSDGTSHMNGDHYQSESSYDTISPSDQEQQPRRDDQGHQEQRQYYLPASVYLQETAKYDAEIVLDSIEDELDSSQTVTPPPHRTARAQSRHPPAAGRVHYNPQQTNDVHTPTAQWSRSYSPEERMRVGLPRWETEQDRIDYYEPQQGEDDPS